MRRSFIAFCLSIALNLLVVVAIWSGSTVPETAPGLSALAVAAIGLLCLTGLVLFRRRTLKCGSDKELFLAYFRRLYALLAFAIAPALAGFSATVLSDSMTPYLVGAGFAACGLALTAPTRAEVERTQEVLNSQGCNRSLGVVLANPIAWASK